MRILVDVVEPARVERGRAPDNAVHLVALAQQKLSKIGAVLPRHACDEGTLGRTHFSMLLSGSAGDTVGDRLAAFTAAALIKRAKALVPVRNFAQTVGKANAGLESEGFLRPARLELAAGLTVGLSAVP